MMFSLIIQSLLKIVVGVTSRLTRKITPLTIRNFRWGFRKSFFENLKNIYAKISVGRGIIDEKQNHLSRWSDKGGCNTAVLCDAVFG
ncbi:MAG: hypothetical protein FWG63_12970 [Defluviitaleaceae bacterium]|nr:hypothetical protein [Defluviitaleaceae bacterium]